MSILSALLLQYDDRLHPLVYFSNKYVLAKRNYVPHNKELLAIFKACQKWRFYLDRHQTTDFTDYKPLVDLQIQPYLLKRQVRLERLNELCIIIVCKPGPLQVVANTFPQNPQTKQLYLSDSETSLASQWLHSNAPQYSTKQCVDAAVDAL